MSEFWTNKRVCVTGGAGFIASHVVDLYLKNGHEVVVIDNLSSGDRVNLNPQAKFIEADITELRTEPCSCPFQM